MVARKVDRFYERFDPARFIEPYSIKPALEAMGLLDPAADESAWYWIMQFNSEIKLNLSPPRSIWAASKRNNKWGWDVHTPTQEIRIRTSQLWGAYYDWTLREDERFWKGLVGYGRYFEWHVASLFAALRWDVSLTSSSYDHGIDIVLEQSQESRSIDLAINYMLRDGPAIIQCKATEKPANRAMLNQLRGTALHQKARWAVLASINGLTRDALRYLESIEGDGLNYLSAAELAKAARQISIVRRAPESAV